MLSEILLVGLELIALTYLGLHYYEVKLLRKHSENNIDPKELRALESSLDDIYTDLMDRIDGLGVIKSRNKSREQRAQPEVDSSNPILSQSELAHYQRGGK